MVKRNGNTTNLVMVDPSINAKKFWTVRVQSTPGFSHSPACVVCTWGRIGSTGQTKTFEFDSVSEAYAYADKKTYEKLDKGYDKSPNPSGLGPEYLSKAT